MTEKELYRQTLERALLSGDAMKRRILRESDAENVSPARETGRRGFTGAGSAVLSCISRPRCSYASARRWPFPRHALLF